MTSRSDKKPEPPGGATGPGGLRVEHLDGAVLGLGDPSPRLSWQLPPGSAHQRRYRIAIDGVAQDWVDSPESVLVPWPTEPVPPRTRVEWCVQVVTDTGTSAWSSTAWFETGLGPGDWTAEWIEPPRADGGRSPRPAYLLRGTFELAGAPAVARMYATAHGVYEAFLNGRRVGDRELTPGYTSYWHHIDVQTFDVTTLLWEGRNDWTVVLSDGWYRGRVGNNQDIDTFGDQVAFLGQLHADGVVIGTGADWAATTGAVVAADLMDGQHEDRTISPGPWLPVEVADHGSAMLTTSPAPPTRRVDELRPVAVRRLDPDRQIVDLGQNINGWIRLHDVGPAGADISLVHGEALGPDGDVTLEHLGSLEHTLHQTDRIVPTGAADETFEPRHTTHGFRYVRVEGHPHRLTPHDVTGVVVHTDLRRTGWFRCSDERINRLHEIADRSFRGNACEIPTDCPQRERSGWTGDWQLFFPSAAFLYDVAGFSEKWLRSLAADQLPSGCLTNMAPEPRRARRSPDDLTWTGMLGSAGWGDAVVLVPWGMHLAYGDEQILDRMWPAMVRWLDFAVGMANSQRHRSRQEQRPEPSPHERYLWDAGWHWGEWMEPGTPEQPFWEADQGHVATAYLHRSATVMARIANVLGHRADAARYDELAAKARDAWQTEYLADDGGLTPDTQANHVRGLVFGLVPDTQRARTAARLVELVRAAGDHLTTGFLATPDLLPVLADTGHLDVAYDLLFQDTPPSWLTMVDRGATTVWESWEGIADDGSPHESLNHYSKGAVIAFLHTRVAGIQLLDDHPAYRRFRVAPQPDRRLEWAEAVHDSPYGRIESSWSCRDGVFRLVVTVPPGTVADAHLPDGTQHTCGPGTFCFDVTTL